MKRTHLAAIATVATAALAFFLWLPRDQPGSPPEAQTSVRIAPWVSAPSSTATASPTPASPGPPAILALASAPVKSDVAPDVPLARRQESIGGDLEMMRTFISEYRNVFGENPVGTNAEITRALTGGNSRQVSFFDRRSPILNAEGEMIDRWGKPYFFHQISGQEMKIRSAGPDRKMWSKDDIELE